MIDASSRLELEPTDRAAGAVVRGIDFSTTPEESTVDAIRQALTEYGVLLFRGNGMGEAEQIDFTRSFGEVTGHPLGRIGGNAPDEADANTFYLTNEPEENPADTAGGGELGWHTDLEYMPEPQVYSVLCALEVPPEGGETEYCNLRAAYDALDNETSERIEKLQAERQFVRDREPVVHPLVRVLPGSGKKSLYLSPGLTHRVVGLDEAESRALLDQLFDHIVQEPFCWKHEWQQGDVLMWDNRLTIHRRHAFDLSRRRVVRRTQTVGEPVVGVA